MITDGQILDEAVRLVSEDVSVTLPILPKGKWELRLGTCLGYAANSVVQFYIDEVPQGVPVDFRPDGRDEKIGWKDDYSYNRFSYALRSFRFFCCSSYETPV